MNGYLHNKFNSCVDGCFLNTIKYNPCRVINRHKFHYNNMKWRPFCCKINTTPFWWWANWASHFWLQNKILDRTNTWANKQDFLARWVLVMASPKIRTMRGRPDPACLPALVAGPNTSFSSNHSVSRAGSSVNKHPHPLMNGCVVRASTFCRQGSLLPPLSKSHGHFSSLKRCGKKEAALLNKRMRRFEKRTSCSKCKMSSICSQEPFKKHK